FPLVTGPASGRRWLPVHVPHVQRTCGRGADSLLALTRPVRCPPRGPPASTELSASRASAMLFRLAALGGFGPDLAQVLETEGKPALVYLREAPGLAATCQERSLPVILQIEGNVLFLKKLENTFR